MTGSGYGIEMWWVEQMGSRLALRAKNECTDGEMSLRWPFEFRNSDCGEMALERTGNAVQSRSIPFGRLRMMIRVNRESAAL